MAQVNKRDVWAVQFLWREFGNGGFKAWQAAEVTPTQQDKYGIHTATAPGVPCSISGWQRRLQTLEERGLVRKINGLWSIADAAREFI